MESRPAAALGDDGQGYELARRLDGCNAWREWLGDADYASFAPALASPGSWDAFLSPSVSPVNLRLQLRVRTLLFVKASSAAYAATVSIASTATPSPANINPSYLQLHGDDVYFSLEDDSHDGGQQQKQSRVSSALSKGNEHPFERGSNRASQYESDSTSLRNRHDEIADMWYSIYIEKFKMRKQHNLLHGGDKELHRRTSEGMSSYLKLHEMHKRKRNAFVEDSNIISRGSTWENGSYMLQGIASETNNLIHFESSFFPEIMFPSNCVPDTALPINSRKEEVCKVEICGALDNLPNVISSSPAMMERFGVKPEYVGIGSKCKGNASGGNKRLLSEEQATRLTQKVIARLLTNIGFDGGSEISMEVFADFIGHRIRKLGQVLKLLTDGYRKQFSSIEFLKMFLQIIGYRNVGVLLEITKDANKGVPIQPQQHVRALHSQQSNPLLQAQQFQRQMHPQTSTLHSQNMAFHQQQPQLQPQQQQWIKHQMRKPATPRGTVMMVDKDHAIMQDIKMENIMDLPMDGTFGSFSKQQRQLRHPQMAMVSQNAQASPQLKPLPSVQISQLQAQNQYNNSMRMPQVKAEAFQEFVSGDPTLKHEFDHDKLASPKK